MKKIVVTLVTLLMVCAISISASAQNKFKLELGYNVSIPVGSFKSDYIGKTSFRGGIGEISYAFSPKFSLGVESGYQNYYQKYGRQLYKLDANQTVSAVLTNSMDIVPLLLRGTFYPMGASATAIVQPYVSAGAGVNLINYGQYLGEFGGTQSSTAFALQGGAGIKIPFGNRINQNGIKVGATYNFCNYHSNDVSKLNNVGVSAGVIFGLK